MTTLIDELEQAANRTRAWAMEADSVGREDLASKYNAEAARLRQRAAWVREYVAAFATAEGGYSEAVRGALKQLTGPIPSETAPADPCETCKGAREVLWMYARGPGDPPGNAMMPCPTCRPAAPKEGTVCTWCEARCEHPADENGVQAHNGRPIRVEATGKSEGERR